MLSPEAFVRHVSNRGFTLFAGVPCSYLSPLINCVIDSDGLRYVGAANEGEAVAIGAGAEIGGRRAVVMIQNSGLGNAVNPLSSLHAIFDIPVLLIVTLRGDPQGPPDEPQHALMGRTTGLLLDLLEIPWTPLPGDDEAAADAVDRAVGEMDRRGRPFALVVRRDSLLPHALRRPTAVRTGLPPSSDRGAGWPDARPSRHDAVQAILQSADRASDVVIGTTGYTGRLMYALDDRAGQLALVGSMGCAAPFGLGLAIAQPRRRVIVIDGDGAILMRLGALATIGYQRPENLVHVCLDNEAHDSTGGQPTVAHSMDLGEVARACGYVVDRARSAGELAALLTDARTSGPRFIHVKTASDIAPSPPRPRESPAAAARRLKDHLGA